MIFIVIISIFYSTFICCNGKLKTQSKVVALLVYGLLMGVVALLS